MQAVRPLAGAPCESRIVKDLESVLGGPVPAWRALASSGVVVTATRGQGLPGANKPMLWWICEGTIAAHFDVGDRTHIAGYAQVGDIFMASFPKEIMDMLGIASRYPMFDSSIANTRKRGVALERSVVAGVALQVVVDLAQRYPQWQRLIMTWALRMATFHMHREYQYLTMDAEKRYLAFLEEFPRIAKIISQRQAANFLGLTPVGLNRVVSRLRREGRLDSPGA